MKLHLSPVGTGLALALAIALPVASAASAAVVFSTNFDSGLPAQFSAPGATVEPVQGYAGLGPIGRQFGGNFLRYSSVAIFPTKLTLRGLPTHDHLSVKFLFGAIDSWDGTELMQVRVDGSLKFNHWFQLALGDSTDYYPPPPGALLSKSVNLGFNNGSYHFRDRAYDLGVEPAFLDIPHTADSVIVVWELSAISGGAASQWQGGLDESWAIDAVSVEVSTLNTGVDADLAAGRLSLEASANPQRAASVRFALPSAEMAKLELIDLAGRRLATREVAGAGVRTLDLAAGQSLTPGIYFARLTQGASVRSVRIAVRD